MLKIRGTEIRQEILSLMRCAVGPYALPFIEEAQYEGYADEPDGPKEAATAAANYLTTASCRSSAAPMKSRRTSFKKNDLGLGRLPR